MSRRNKLIKFTEILTFPNVYENYDTQTDVLTAQNREEIRLKGTWGSHHFKNSNPITLELACGRGEYTLALAERYPERNFIGVDVKGARIWKGAKLALDRGLTNVAFLRSRIEVLDNFFGPGEVSEIWITFPDPFLKKRKANRRLTAEVFLKRYSVYLQNGGLINLKTDSEELYSFTQKVLMTGKHEVLKDYHDIYSDHLPHPDLDIQTYYEKQHLENNKTIKFIQFRTNYP